MEPGPRVTMGGVEQELASFDFSDTEYVFTLSSKSWSMPGHLKNDLARPSIKMQVGQPRMTFVFTCDNTRSFSVHVLICFTVTGEFDSLSNRNTVSGAIHVLFGVSGNRR